MRYKLKKQSILKKKKQFQKVYKIGKSFSNRYMVIYVSAADEIKTKAGFAAGKRLGNAVVRNRVKRMLREAYRTYQHRIKMGLHLIIVGRNPIVGAKSDLVGQAFVELAKKAKIFI